MVIDSSRIWRVFSLHMSLSEIPPYVLAVLHIRTREGKERSFFPRSEECWLMHLVVTWKGVELLYMRIKQSLLSFLFFFGVSECAE